MAASDADLAARWGIAPEQVSRLRRLRGTSNARLEKVSPEQLRKLMRKLAFPDAARERQDFEVRQQRGDDNKPAPPRAMAKALQQCASMRMKASGVPAPRSAVAAAAAGAAAAGAVAARSTRGRLDPLALVGAATEPAVPRLARAAGLSTTRWQWLGPGNIGGRTRALVIHPREPQRMLAASAGGGVWFTANGGARWDPVDDFMANLAVCSLCVDPTNPNLVYAGTGEGFGNLDALRGAGIFRIVGGASWQAIPATAGFGAVNRIGVSRHGKTVLAATANGLMRSIDAARAVWTRVLPGPIADVKCQPRDSRRAIAGSTQGGQAWYSTNGGLGWKLATHAGAPWEGRVELCYARRDPRIVYASVDSQEGGQIWRSVDGGKTYSQRAARDVDGRPAAFLGGQGWYDNVVWAGDPTDADLVLVGGVNLWRSKDGGQTLHEISSWMDSRSIHADHHAIVAHPLYDGVHNRTVFFGNDGGVWKADDVSVPGSATAEPFVTGWQELNNNYGVTQFYGGAVHAATGRVVGGTQDNGSLALQPGADSEHWNSWFGGDGGDCASDPADAQVFYGEYIHLNIHRNVDGAHSDDPDRYISGQFWNGAAGQWQWKPVPFQIPDARTQDALFIAPFVLDARNPQRLLGGGLSLWQTTNARAPNTPTSGPRWAAIKAPTGSLISALAISPANSDVVWVGHDNGAVFRTVNSTAAAPAWQRCGTGAAGALTPRRMCTGITAHPQAVGTAYATFGGFDSNNVWRTTDGGLTWTPLPGLPAAPVRAFAVHPRRHDRLYAGTEVGVFGSDDGGLSWSPGNEGPANVSIDDLFWAGETLHAATHGRGMYRIDLRGI